MNIKLQNYLISNFPNLFNKKLKNPISCSDGWFYLINFCFETVTAETNKKNFELEKLNQPPILIEIEEVLEKNGKLNFTYKTEDLDIQNIFNLVEKLSNYVCEETGKFDETIGKTSKHWVKTVSKAQADPLDWKSIYSNQLLGVIEEIKALS
jgi:hypothetical protein